MKQMAVSLEEASLRIETHSNEAVDRLGLSSFMSSLQQN